MGLRSLMNAAARSRLAERGRRELVEERIGFSGETENIETVAVVQVFHAEEQRFFRLVEFLSRHRAGGVEHEKDILGHDALVGNIEPGGSQQEEIAVLAAGAIGQEIQADLVFFGGEIEREIGVRREGRRFRRWRWLWCCPGV